jgi:Superinfection immunity protein
VNAFEIVLVVLAGLAVLAGLVALYWLPVIIARRRGVPERGQIIAINLMLGWTLAGWTVALVMALKPQLPPAGYYPQIPRQN